MVRGVRVRGPALAPALPVAHGGQPGMYQHVLRGETVLGVLLQQGSDETLGPRTQALGQVELTAPDFGKQAAVLCTMKRIPAKYKNM